MLTRPPLTLPPPVFTTPALTLPPAMLTTPPLNLFEDLTLLDPIRAPLYIVPCSQTKDDQLVAGATLPARDAYAGQAFRMARAALESAGLRWCILSAGYGFIWPEFPIANYDTKMQLDGQQCRTSYFRHLSESQHQTLRAAESITVVGSRLYADAAALLLGRPVAAPVAGLPIGKMLGAIKSLRWMHAF